MQENKLKSLRNVAHMCLKGEKKDNNNKNKNK